MLKIILSLSIIFIVLVITELFWRMRKLSDEVTRKIVHITVAIFVASWPFYMTYKQIQLIAIAFLIVTIISRQLHIFKGILHVKRKTYGDLFFPLAIFILAVLQPNKTIFALALLNIGLSDGIAALVGKTFGKHNKYKVFNQVKSISGTLAFIITSYLIFISAKIICKGDVEGLTWFNVLILPPILAFIENISVYGADDLTIPLVLLVVMKWL